MLISSVTAEPEPQSLQTTSYGANQVGLVADGFIFLDPSVANGEYLRVISTDPDNQTFDAVVTKDYAAASASGPPSGRRMFSMKATIWRAKSWPLLRPTPGRI